MPSEQRLQSIYSLVDSKKAKETVEALSGMIADDRKLRWVLRAHWEDVKGIAKEDELSMRIGFDEELFRLELLEVAAETGYLGDADVVAEVSPAMRKLLETAAVQRFVDAYFYFGTRFLSCRIKRVEAKERRETGKPPLVRLEQKSDQNVRKMSLPCPPPLPGLPASMEINTTAHHVMDDFIEQQKDMLADRDVNRVLDFLDDCVPVSTKASTVPSSRKGEAHEYLLWLRGLLPVQDEEQLSRFEQYTRGFEIWIVLRSDFYKKLGSACLEARFGILSFYMLARILRAEVSPQGVVSYADRSWIDDLRDYAPLKAGNLTDCEKILRRVFSGVCDLIQESFAITCNPDDFEPDVKGCETPVEFRFAFDDELDEIKRQRAERALQTLDIPEKEPVRRRRARMPKKEEEPDCFEDAEWSRRASQKAHFPHLYGLALSGGGIRSATFNLGVMEALRNLDILRKIDYLSTVSGGGYTGAWLAGNVKRTPFFLSKGTNWSESISHLRKFSNYLSPHVGILSADTWTMVLIWIRNTMLIQLTVFATILCLLAGVRVAKLIFDWWPEYGTKEVSIASLVLAIFGISINLFRIDGAPDWLRWFRFGQTRTQWMIVVPLWLMSLLTGSTMWKWSHEVKYLSHEGYGEILKFAYTEWWIYLSVSGVCLWIVAGLTLACRGWLRVVAGLAVAVASIAAMYLALCGIMLMFQGWSGPYSAYCSAYCIQFGWIAFVWAPPLLLATFSLTIVLFLGLLSRQSLEWTREWWTRLGAWLAIYGAGVLAISLATVYGPMLMSILAGIDTGHIKWGAAGAWVLTTALGLISGGGPQTKGDDGTPSIKAMILNAVAKFAAVSFIAGIILLLSAVLQLFFAAVEDLRKFPQGMDYWQVFGAVPPWLILATLVGLCIVTSLFAWRFDINIFSLNSFYRNRLVRCYLGATRWGPNVRKPQPFTGFDENDDLPLKELRVASAGLPYRGPFPIVNCAVNLGGSSDLALHTRHSASFSMTPLFCGADRAYIGYIPTQLGRFTYAGTGNPTLGKAMAISGAAANPNMGYHTSPLVAFLMTLFNVRLGWWFPNPGRESREKAAPLFSLRYLITELFGMAGEKSLFVNLSDGGHFENLGVYELVRRRCKVIIASDSECDERLAFEGLGNLIRICEVDHGAKIKINVDSIRKCPETGRSKSHGAVGRIEYSNGSFGYLIYLKASMTGEEGPAEQQYHSAHPSFPHETTGDQFFTEDQFESYRRLGKQLAERIFRDVEMKADLTAATAILDDLWTPAANPTATFIDHTTGLEEFWHRFQGKPQLSGLADELFRNAPTPTPPLPLPADEFTACVELIQQMENAYLALRLDDHWDHPDNRGWQMRFLAWAKSGRFRAVWSRVKTTHGLQFRHFCDNKLGLPW